MIVVEWHAKIIFLFADICFWRLIYDGHCGLVKPVARTALHCLRLYISDGEPFIH